MNTAFTRNHRVGQDLANPGSAVQKTLIDHYTNMHEISRHLIHVSETLHLSRQTIERMMNDHTNQCCCLQHHSVRPGMAHREPSPKDQLVAGHTSYTLSIYASLMSGLEMRNQAFQERLRNETKLVRITKVLSLCKT